MLDKKKILYYLHFKLSTDSAIAKYINALQIIYHRGIVFQLFFYFPLPGVLIANGDEIQT